MGRLTYKFTLNTIIILVYLVQVLPRRDCFDNNSLQLLKTVLSETKIVFHFIGKKLVAGGGLQVI